MKILAWNAVEVLRCPAFTEWFKWNRNEILLFTCHSKAQSLIELNVSQTWHLITRLARYTWVLMAQATWTTQTLTSFMHEFVPFKSNAVFQKVLCSLDHWSSFQLTASKKLFQLYATATCWSALCSRDQNSWTEYFELSSRFSFNEKCFDGCEHGEVIKWLNLLHIVRQAAIVSRINCDRHSYCVVKRAETKRKSISVPLKLTIMMKTVIKAWKLFTSAFVFPMKSDVVEIPPKKQAEQA